MGIIEAVLLIFILSSMFRISRQQRRNAKESINNPVPAITQENNEAELIEDAFSDDNL